MPVVGNNLFYYRDSYHGRAGGSKRSLTFIVHVILTRLRGPCPDFSKYVTRIFNFKSRRANSRIQNQNLVKNVDKLEVF